MVIIYSQFSYKMQIQRIFKFGRKLSAGFGILTKTPAAEDKCCSGSFLHKSESKGWGTNEQESPK